MSIIIPSTPQGGQPVWVISKDLPVKVRRVGSEFRIDRRQSNLIPSLHDLRMNDGGISSIGSTIRFIGLCGLPEEGNELSQEDKMVVANLLKSFGCYPVWPSNDILHRFLAFSNKELWPLLHNVTMTSEHSIEFHPNDWSGYRSMNALYVDTLITAITLEKDLSSAAASIATPIISNSQNNISNSAQAPCAFNLQSNTNTPVPSPLSYSGALGAGHAVWIHDLHLMVAPQFVRSRSACGISFFLHSPFCSAELLRTLPVGSEILRCLLNADVVGFQFFEYARHFMVACTRQLGLESQQMSGRDLGVVLGSGERIAKIRISHAVLDAPSVENSLLTSPHAKDLMVKLMDRYKGRSVLCAVDSADRMSGVLLKLKAIDDFLTNYAYVKGKIVLAQHLLPSSPRFGSQPDEIIQEVLQLAASINLKHGAHIDITVGDLPRWAKWGLFRIASVYVDTSIRQGLNLNCFEFMLCRTMRVQENGLIQTKPLRAGLIVSEFAGSSYTLQSGIRVNPWRPTSTCEALDKSLLPFFKPLATDLDAFWTNPADIGFTVLDEDEDEEEQENSTTQSPQKKPKKATVSAVFPPLVNPLPVAQFLKKGGAILEESQRFDEEEENAPPNTATSKGVLKSKRDPNSSKGTTANPAGVATTTTTQPSLLSTQQIMQILQSDKRLLSDINICRGMTTANWTKSMVSDLMPSTSIAPPASDLPLLTLTPEELEPQLSSAWLKNPDGYNLILLDHEGTLAPDRRHLFGGKNLSARGTPPSATVLQCLYMLASNPRNIVVVLSGRDRNSLDSWFGSVSDRVGICAEHGFYIKCPALGWHGWTLMHNKMNNNDNELLLGERGQHYQMREKEDNVDPDGGLGTEIEEFDSQIIPLRDNHDEVPHSSGFNGPLEASMESSSHVRCAEDFCLTTQLGAERSKSRQSNNLTDEFGKGDSLVKSMSLRKSNSIVQNNGISGPHNFNSVLNRELSLATISIQQANSHQQQLNNNNNNFILNNQAGQSGFHSSREGSSFFNTNNNNNNNNNTANTHNNVMNVGLLAAVRSQSIHGSSSMTASGIVGNEAEPLSDWKLITTMLMEQYVARTQGSLIENKGSALVFQHRSADPELGKWQASDLAKNLRILLQSSDEVNVIEGKGYVEVRMRDVNKGVAVQRLLERLYSVHPQAWPPCLLFAAGDDRSDEEMFAVVNSFDGSIIPDHHNEKHQARNNSTSDFQSTDVSPQHADVKFTDSLDKFKIKSNPTPGSNTAVRKESESDSMIAEDASVLHHMLPFVSPFISAQNNHNNSNNNNNNTNNNPLDALNIANASRTQTLLTSPIQAQVSDSQLSSQLPLTTCKNPVLPSDISGGPPLASSPIASPSLIASPPATACLTVLVGHKRSQAKHFVRTPDAMEAILQSILSSTANLVRPPSNLLPLPSRFAPVLSSSIISPFTPPAGSLFPAFGVGPISQIMSRLAATHQTSNSIGSALPQPPVAPAQSIITSNPLITDNSNNGNDYILKNSFSLPTRKPAEARSSVMGLFESVVECVDEEDDENAID